MSIELSSEGRRRTATRADWQFLDEADLRDRQLRAMRSQLDYVREHSRFYQDKLSAWNGSLDSYGDLRSLPFTSKEELRGALDADPPLGINLCTAPEDPVRISTTSGTTGKPLYYAVTPRDLETITQSWFHLFDAAGLTSADRAMYGLALGGPYGSHYGADAIERAGIQCIPIGSAQSSERFIQLLVDLKPTVLLCVTSFPLRIAERLREKGIDPRSLGVKKMMMGAEPVAPVRAAIEEAWDTSVYELMGCGEIGMIWGECEHHGGMHHLAKDVVLVEYIDPVTAEHVTPEVGRTAELVYTHLCREAHPVVRFRTHDLVTFQSTDCPCGRRGPRVACVGRTDDMLKVRGANIFPSALVDLLTRFGAPVTANFRVRLPGGARKFSTPLSLVVEVDSGADGPATAELRDRLEAYLRANLNVRSLVDLVPVGELGENLRGPLDRHSYFIDA